MEPFLAMTGVADETAARLRGTPVAWAELEALAHTLAYDDALLGDGSVPVERFAAVAARTLVVCGGFSTAPARAATLGTGGRPAARPAPHPDGPDAPGSAAGARAGAGGVLREGTCTRTGGRRRGASPDGTYAGGTRDVLPRPVHTRVARPVRGRPVRERAIIHVTQGSFASAVKVFQDPAHQAATHYIVGQDGRVVQMIRELDVAYQAELLLQRARGRHRARGVRGPAQDLTKEMYAASARLTASICARHGIPVDREHIIGHVEVPGTDHRPGPHWDWDRYMELVRRAATAPATASPSASPSAKA
ncbi:hypothetical protein SCALM49S_06639 [Streptomyces californicus]